MKYLLPIAAVLAASSALAQTPPEAQPTVQAQFVEPSPKTPLKPGCCSTQKIRRQAAHRRSQGDGRQDGVHEKPPAAADGLLLVTPEYNNSVPGVAKNAIDWLSRPAADIARVFGGKPVAIAGASPGGFGTLLSQNAWLPVFKTLGAELWPGGRLLVPRAGNVFGAHGEIQDPQMRESVRSFLAGFAAFAAERKRVK